VKWRDHSFGDADVAQAALEVSLRALKTSQDQAPPDKGDLLVGRERVQQRTVFVERADALIVGHRDLGSGAVGPGALGGGFGERGRQRARGDRS